MKRAIPVHARYDRRAILIESIAVISCLCLLMAALSIRIGLVVSESMEPTYMVGQRQAAFRFAYLLSPPKAGDVILFDMDGDVVCKRVIGIPGDTIGFTSDGRITINDKVMDEPYAKGATLPSKSLSYTVPEGSYFVLGDNRMNSYDSRYWTDPYVRKGDISAKVLSSF